MVKKIEPKTLSGFKDVLPKEALIKGRMLHTLRSVFESFGFAPIETPHLEYTEMLINETSGDISKQLYRFQDQGDRDVCLRFDLTVPFARFVVQHKNDLGIPFKRYAIGNVFRGERPQLGRYREFTQCDFDIVGVPTGPADAEIVQVIAKAMQALQIDRFLIRINNRKVMNGLARSCGVTAENTAELLRIVDKLDKIGPKDVKDQLVSGLSLSEKVVDELLAFVVIKADLPEQVLGLVENYKSRHELMAEGLNELENISKILSALEGTAGKFNIDFSIARGLGYYTGIVYETSLLDLPQIGSVCSGGRYDNLTMNFSKDSLPGVGASVGLDRLIAALLELSVVKISVSPSSLLIVVMEEALFKDAYHLADQLRQKSLAVEVYPEAEKVKKQFQYADRKEIPFALVLGSDEVAKKIYTLKNLASGKQFSCASLAEIESILNS